MKFDYNNIPEETKLIAPVSFSKIIKKSMEIDIEAKNIFEDMLDLGWKLTRACSSYNGVGLAAPQIGVNKRAFIFVDVEDPEVWKFNGTFSLYINPEFKVKKDSERRLVTEGCLSVPNGKRYPILRASDIVVSYWYFNEKGKIRQSKNEPMCGYAARMFAHEYDHLEAENIISLHEKQNSVKRRKKKSVR